MKKHTIKLLTVAITLAAILTLTGCPGPVTPDNPCTHENKKAVIETAATCTETGLEKIICADCGELIEENTIEALGHDFGEWDVTTAATCTADGEETRTCKREGCKHFETRTIKAHHSWGDWTVTKEATCNEKGSKKHTCSCSNCGAEETVEIDALGHEWEEIITDKTKAATCTENGIAVYKCKTCGAIEERTVSKLGHSYGNWNVTKEATCTTGTKKRVCSRCGHEEIETIPAHHTFIAGGCDKCGAYEYNEEDDYQIMAYVYSSVEDAKKDENKTVLYFSFPNDTTDIPQIVIGNNGPEITIDNLIQMKSGYVGRTVKYFGYQINWFLQDIEGNQEYHRNTKLLTNLENKDASNNVSPIYIVIE